MCWYERIHESLKVGPPPLSKTFANFPVSSLLALAYATDGGKPLIEPDLEAFLFSIIRPKVVARELEKCVCNLKHQNMWVVVFMTNENAFAGATHAMVGEVLLETFQPGDNGGIFFRLRFLDAKCVVRKGVESDFLGLLGIEI